MVLADQARSGPLLYHELSAAISLKPSSCKLAMHVWSI